MSNLTILTLSKVMFQHSLGVGACKLSYNIHIYIFFFGGGGGGGGGGVIPSRDMVQR